MIVEIMAKVYSLPGTFLKLDLMALVCYLVHNLTGYERLT